MTKLSYKDKLRQTDREAFFTFISAIFITVVFWGSIWLFKDSDTTIFSMPLWFVASCLVGYLISIVVVLFLVKFCFKNIDFDEND